MRFRLPDNQIVQIDSPFRFGEVQYPAGWLRGMTPAERTQFGAIELSECPTVNEAYYYVTETAPGLYEVAVKPLEQLKQRKLAELAALRYSKETGGLSGYRTDRESQALLTGAALAATIDPGYTVDWKGSDGWVTLNAAQLLGAAQAVRAYVQACFSNERAHAEAIEALQAQQDVINYDITTGWPS